MNSKKDNQKNFWPHGGNIKKARIDAHMTQQKLGDAIGKTLSSVQKYELGLTTPPIDVLEKISTVLDVGMGELLDLGYEPEEDEHNKKLTDLRERLEDLGISIQDNDCGEWEIGSQTLWPDQVLSTMEKIKSDAEKRKENYIKQRLIAEFGD